MTIDTTATAIAEAWEAIEAAHTELRQLPDHADDREQWAIIDRAEMEALAAKPRSLADVALKLRLALLHTLSDRDHEAAVIAGDFAFLSTCEGDLDFSDRLVFSALTALVEMEG